MEGLGPQGHHVAHLKTPAFPSLIVFLPGKKRPCEIRKAINWKKMKSQNLRARKGSKLASCLQSTWMLVLAEASCLW